MSICGKQEYKQVSNVWRDAEKKQSGRMFEDLEKQRVWQEKKKGNKWERKNVEE